MNFVKVINYINIYKNIKRILMYDMYWIGILFEISKRKSNILFFISCLVFNTYYGKISILFQTIQESNTKKTS